MIERWVGMVISSAMQMVNSSSLLQPRIWVYQTLYPDYPPHAGLQVAPHPAEAAHGSGTSTDAIPGSGGSPVEIEVLLHDLERTEVSAHRARLNILW